MEGVKRQGCLFVLSGPCGTGKTSLAMALLEDDPHLGYTRSVTTRKPRSEAESHYDYVSRPEFIEMVKSDEFVQWIHPAYDEFYGTRHAPIREAIAKGQDLVFDYCPEGMLNLKRAYPDNVVSVFIMAPSVEEMRRRLANRGTEDEEEQKLRYRMALQDFNFVDQHDYYVVNDNFEEALATLHAIRKGEHARLCRQDGVTDYYAGLAIPALLRYYDSGEFE